MVGNIEFRPPIPIWRNISVDSDCFNFEFLNSVIVKYKDHNLAEDALHGIQQEGTGIFRTISNNLEYCKRLRGSVDGWILVIPLLNEKEVRCNERYSR